MVKFKRIQSSRLYISEDNFGESGWWLVVIQEDFDGDAPDTLNLDLALNDVRFAASFIYVADRPGSITQNELDFVNSIDEIIQRSDASSAILFLSSGAVDHPEYIIPIDRARGKVTATGGLSMNLAGDEGLKFECTDTAILSVDPSGEGITFTATSKAPSAKLRTNDPNTFTDPAMHEMILSMTGASSGAFVFEMCVASSRLVNDLNAGFQFVIPPPRRSNHQRAEDYLAVFIPLIDVSDSTGDTIEFRAQVNVLNPHNIRCDLSHTKFFFTGRNKSGSPNSKTILSSCYRTETGRRITLLPVADGAESAALMITPCDLPTTNHHSFKCAPVGDFQIGVEGASNGEEIRILAGIFGHETLAIPPSDDSSQSSHVLRFVQNQAATAGASFGRPVDPVGAPGIAVADLIGDQFRTSWVSIIAQAPGAKAAVQYCARPAASSLYSGNGAAANAPFTRRSASLMIPADGRAVFPLFPASGIETRQGAHAFSDEDYQRVEQNILVPVRRAQIKAAAMPGTASSDPVLSTTTAGFEVQISPDGTLEHLLLAQTLGNAGRTAQQFGFTHLNPQLQAAFLYESSFMVLNNSVHLGQFCSDELFAISTIQDGAGKPRFHNKIEIEGWSFAANVGQTAADDEYRNVVLIKNCKSPICRFDASGDIDPASLIADPQKWLMPQEFALSQPDGSAGLKSIAGWLNSYCARAWASRGDPYFEGFLRILDDPNWCGVLILQLDIVGVPEDLRPVLPGTKGSAALSAHHVAIEAGPKVSSEPGTDKNSSISGLIYATDQNFSGAEDIHPDILLQAEAQGEDICQSLKVRFEHSAVHQFESFIRKARSDHTQKQATGHEEDRGSNAPSWLKVSYQKHAGRGRYTFEEISAENR
ncbi:hypothetical protein FGU71_00025 [Erythrobacter insulae]|uniref:Uncharacterized protein n=1 Tax=Erythrobacter insulae TaxID=2584124 RepID=A0A547P8G1_9SPHN|nr:hypothetical protein [Erythrobacter insulae]TRD10416.1 hypothetical protein FGU71_00025 [Erythrobacter insulae]